MNATIRHRLVVGCRVFNRLPRAAIHQSRFPVHKDPQWIGNDSSRSTTGRTFSSSSGDDFQRRYSELQRRSRENVSDKKELETLIDGWRRLMVDYPDQQQKPIDVELVNELYQVWKDLPNEDCSAPYKSMLDIFSTYSPFGSRALQVLNDWENSALAGNMALQSTEEHYVQVLTAYYRSQNESNGPDVTQELIHYLENSWKGGIVPNIHHYGMAVSNIRLGLERDETASKQLELYAVLETYMDKIFQKFDRSNESHNKTLAQALRDAFGSLQILTSIIDPAFDESSHKRIAEWRLHWTRLVDDSALWSTLPNSLPILEQTSHDILKYLSDQVYSTNSADVKKHLEAMTQLVIQLYDMKNQPMLPSSRHYILAIRAWGQYRDNHNNADQGAAREQQNLLLKCMTDQFYDTKKDVSEPRLLTEFWNHLMQACIATGAPDLVKELWDDNLSESSNDKIRVVRDQKSFTILLQSLAIKRQRDTPFRAQARATFAHSVLQKLIKYDISKRTIEPDSEHFGYVMAAWAFSHHGKAAQYAQDVFDQLLKQPNMEPSAIHYNALVYAWGYSRLPGAHDRVLKVFDAMQKSNVSVDISSYSAVLFALSRQQSAEAALQAERLLKEMEEKSKLPGGEFLKPNLACYNSVLYAWHHSNAEDAFEHCKDLFQIITKKYEDSGFDPAFRPDSTTFVTLMEALITSNVAKEDRDIGTFAERMLGEIEAKSAIGKAEKPDAKVYTAVMKAHWKDARPDAGIRAGNVLNRMKEAYASGNLEAKPDTHAMTVLIMAWAVSSARNKALVAWNILKEMQDAFEHGDIDMVANRYAYGAVLNACAHTESDDSADRKTAVEVALSILSEIESGKVDGGLNQHTFRSLFNVLEHQIDETKEQSKYAEIVFRRCCETGYVDRTAVEALKRYARPLYNKLPRSGSQLLLPRNWTRNVPKNKRHELNVEAA